MSPAHSSPTRRAVVRRGPSRQIRRRRLALGAAGLAVLVGALISTLGGGGLPRLPRPGPAPSVRAGNPFGYSSSHAAQGSDPADAAGLTQILAQTGQSLLRMHINLARSRQLTTEIANAAAYASLTRLQARRAAIDDRFDPPKELAATVRYLQLAQRQFGRADLAIVSYHMGIGNLQQVLDDYNGGRPVPYAQLYFDTAPSRHATAYDLLHGFGDDSSLYYWRVLGAMQVMALYRHNRRALARLTVLQTASDSAAEVLHPPDRTPRFSDPSTLDQAYQARTVVPLPAAAAHLGLAYGVQMGASAKSVGAPVALYRGLRPGALAMLVGLAHDVRALSHVSAPLTVAGAVSDMRYQRMIGVSDPPATTGYTFALLRRYANVRQATALQDVLDRLQALNLIAWARGPTTIDVTVASDAARVIADRTY